ncbi:uncharacterized protein TRAVEDRAFT_69180 [Trametes versicolor FP-101664 SS1]|uniref:uncharacterized protein n=1 Tax=Trametes versicolor (strain FP-101664) TaxID=717944 RepID=UPI00046235E8|nr:uncharacterized protein TRAVEDRAFT_69180 [Trametes versicolor FP-101664 SS1]EIW63023.1 hypothetical protein TRAVEDRAFT_69180 [Trametes versicolor FP-101664 SS1]
MFLSKTLVFLSVALSALAGPGHVARGVHHRDIAHRAAMPFAQPEPVVASARRRADTGRCKAHPSIAASPTVAPLNVESDPATTKAAPATTKHTTTKAAAPTHATGSSSGDSALANFLPGTNTGEATFYMTGLTACGVTNKDTDYIAAVSHLLFDTYPGYNGLNPNNNPLCGRKVTATYQGKSVTVAITDRCTKCALTDLDFSYSAFDQIGDEAVGRLYGMTWVWAD